MKFGMNLLLWTGDLTDQLVPTLEMIKRLGYDGVELPIFSPDESKFAAWGKRLDDLGLERTGVTVRVEENNPISSEPAVRARGVDQNKRTLDCCQAAGCSLLAGPFHSAIGVFSGAGPTADEWKWGVDSMRQVAEHAGQVGVTLAVEALNRFEIYLLNSHLDSARFVREVDHPNCRMMFDTFHANIEDKRFGEVLRAVGDVLVHVHISENDRSTPGQGHIPWDDTFDALQAINYDGWLMVEAFGLALPELAAATKIWRRMFQSEEQLARDDLAFMKGHYQRRW